MIFKLKTMEDEYEELKKWKKIFCFKPHFIEIKEKEYCIFLSFIERKYEAKIERIRINNFHTSVITKLRKGNTIYRFPKKKNKKINWRKRYTGK